MNPKLSLAMHMALERVRKGASVRQAAADTGLWPQSVYLACKREGITPKGYKPRAVQRREDKTAIEDGATASKG
jgi:hypothetical protein